MTDGGGGEMDGARRGVLNRVRAQRDPATALEYYDSLPPVTLEQLFGQWRGSGLQTGHPLDGLLETFGWYGKRFDDAETVHPLIFTTRGGGLVSINPRFIPLGLLVRRPRLARLPTTGWLFRATRRLLTTSKPAARLRMVQYRGVVTASMCYDALPIHDVFRRIDRDTVLGAMDARGSTQPFMFVLVRDQRMVEMPTQSPAGG